MGMNDSPRSVRLHIGFFGCRNAGKSSLVNALTNQQMSVVSQVAGTTTDPVSKSMEILPAGPVVITDTPGFDDEGGLGKLRVQRTREILGRCDLAVLVVDASMGIRQADRELLGLFGAHQAPCILVWNKADLVSPEDKPSLPDGSGLLGQIHVSSVTGENITALRELIGQAAKKEESHRQNHLAGDLISPLDLVLLVIPIDESAPKGRLILPQQQVLRDVLDHGGQVLCVREEELDEAIAHLPYPPALVVTDSQAFAHVAKVVPDEIPMTSFSILMARYKGALLSQLQGIRALKNIQDGDRILIAEGCTHHRQCGDIGTVKLPAWIRSFTGKEPIFETSSGLSFPEDLGRYRLIIHCGGCMLNEKEVRERNRRAAMAHVPITNYGMAIAFLHGILERALRPIPEAQEEK
jgi:[FeFe] hydrogenase H-cluster maturation GTPase HydF